MFRILRLRTPYDIWVQGETSHTYNYPPTGVQFIPGTALLVVAGCLTSPLHFTSLYRHCKKERNNRSEMSMDDNSAPDRLNNNETALDEEQQQQQQPTAATQTTQTTTTDYSTLSPPRSSGERSRDALLRLLDGSLFQYLGLIVLFLVIVDGAFFFFLLIGAQRMCRPRTDCDPRNGWYNISVQVLNLLFTYMATVSMPWRCTNAIHVYGAGCPVRSNADGKNLYGMAVADIWFHVPLQKRRGIILVLLANCLTQYANQATRIVYHSYSLQNQSPGNIWTNGTYIVCAMCNVPLRSEEIDESRSLRTTSPSRVLLAVFFVTSMICAAIGGGWQGYEESQLRKAHPDQFPPGPLDLVRSYLGCKKGEDERKEAPDQEHDPTRAPLNPAVVPVPRSSMRLWAM
jgi:hypothetical protein